MSEKSRRRLLQGIAITLPATWSRPVVETLVLPAHAQMSPTECNAEEGCYNVVNSQDSFQWPGGAGPFQVPGYNVPSCEAKNEAFFANVVVAANAAEAANALQCDGQVELIETNPPAPSGCNFFVCEGPK